MDPQDISQTLEGASAPKRKRSDEPEPRQDGQPSNNNASAEDIIMDGSPDITPPSQAQQFKKPRLDDIGLTSRPDDHNTYPRSVALPPEVLQHVLSFLDPFSLGRMLSVSITFEALLDPRKAIPASQLSGRLRVRPQNDIWAHSRRGFYPSQPRPMSDMSELQMWKLTHGIACQFCNKKPAGACTLPSTKPWHSGPGLDGVRTIWPFRVRSCGACLQTRIMKDTELLLSTSSVLMPGLQFAVFTPSVHYINSSTLRQIQPPPEVSLSKYYSRPQVEALENQMVTAKQLGQAIVEEWFKGLEQNTKSQTADVARFEQWEATQTPRNHLEAFMMRQPSNAASSVSSATSPAYSIMSSTLSNNQFSMSSPRPLSNMSTPYYTGPQPASVFGYSTPAYVPFQSLSMVAGQQSPEYHAFSGSFSPMSTVSGNINPSSRPRPERNFQDIIRLKAERRAEIERRCLDLDPPIRASTLTYMDAFNAAVQIPMALNDSAWEVLKGRILVQRCDAERKEAVQTQPMPSVSANAEIPSTTEPAAINNEVEHASAWDNIHRPVRDKIKDIADNYIDSIWAGGRAINKATAGKFAADVLQHVRRRFYEMLTEEDNALAAQQTVIPHDSPIHATRKLKLEDMKWVFDEKVKPHTQRFGRDVFLCSVCESGGKRFSFDAVIQHYAAKHTTELSQGNAVVFWGADWPAEPPFHPSPDTVWNREPDYRPAPGSQYAASQYAASPPYIPNPSASWMSPMYMPTAGQPHNLYTLQSDELVSTALQLWDATEGVQDLSDSVRLFVILRHVAMRLAQHFANEPPLSMFADCIAHKPALRLISGLQGIRCKSCSAFTVETGQSSSANLPVSYLAHELLGHFQKTHIEIDSMTPYRGLTRPPPVSSLDPARIDWKYDMIELPHETVIRDLMYSPGITLQKLQTISSVLPTYFPTPLPQIEAIPLPSGRSMIHTTDDISLQSAYPPRDAAILDRKLYNQTERQGRGYERDYINEAGYVPQRYIEVLPPRELIYVERHPRQEMSTRYAEPPRRHIYGHSDLYDERGESEVARGPLSYPTEPPIRYSPVVDDDVGRPVRMSLDSADRAAEGIDLPAVGSKPASPERDEAHAATENFLNNFDSIGVSGSTGNTPRLNIPDAASPRAVSSLERLSDRGRLSHVGTPNRAQALDDGALSRGSGSRRRTPPRAASGLRSSRNVSPPPIQDDQRGTPVRSSVRPLDLDHPDDGSIELPRPLSRPRSREEPHVDPNWVGRDVTYRDIQSPERRPRRFLARDDSYGYAPAPETHYRRYDAPPKRYIEVLPDGQQRIIEEYSPPVYEPVQYIPRREEYVDRRGYYQEIPRQEVRYVEDMRDAPGPRGQSRPSPAAGDDRRYPVRPYSRHDEGSEPRRR